MYIFIKDSKMKKLLLSKKKIETIFIDLLSKMTFRT